jgi:hypothetical protein
VLNSWKKNRAFPSALLKQLTGIYEAEQIGV